MPKILVDTNILLRHLIDGDKTLQEVAKKGRVWLLDEILIELVFALENHYHEPREVVFDLSVGLLLNPSIDTNRTLLFDALAVYRDRPNLSIVDAYLLVFSQANKVELVTLDRKLGRRVVK